MFGVGGCLNNLAPNKTKESILNEKMHRSKTKGLAGWRLTSPTVGGPGESGREKKPEGMMISI